MPFILILLLFTSLPVQAGVYGQTTTNSTLTAPNPPAAGQQYPSNSIDTGTETPTTSIPNTNTMPTSSTPPATIPNMLVPVQPPPTGIIPAPVDDITLQKRRKDEKISTDYQAILAGHPDLSEQSITVSTVDGIVTLTGTVDNQTQINQAVDLGYQIDGVTNIRSNLIIRPQEAVEESPIEQLKVQEQPAQSPSFN